ncbi:unnamed protein product [Arabis nemorensis]|uniref:Uncharacterized protein n=1 Tax=Arabis nemorensis TaxID=586526 RepID=A0A565C0L2_9BRAS|nr:unnamed protein product [Arabis nemorensis]
MVLNTAIEEDSTMMESMEASSSMDVNSYLKKRKAEADPKKEEGEESDGEVEECRDYEPEPKIDWLKPPDWDVESFDGVEYYSSDVVLSSDDDELVIEHNRVCKRQIIESKGFYVDPELRPGVRFGAGSLPRLNHLWLKDPKVEFVQVVRGNKSGAPRSKSYITFMAREKPDGPLVEYQAKGLLTFNGIRHPVLCRPAPPKP